MKIETEMDAGGAGYFLIDNRVQLLNIVTVRVTQDVKYVGGCPSIPTVEYLVTGARNRSTDREDSVWVPENRSARTKEELLGKL